MALEIITSENLQGIKHGFFTRKGGASTGIFSGLNCGAGSSDQKQVIDINRGRVAQALGVAGDKLIGCHQIHSADVVCANDLLDQSSAKADGIVSATEGTAIFILTADCQPILFADPQAGVIGAAHAGWKGALTGVIENTVAAMVAIGAKRENISACIGPCISQKAYEVGADFYENIVKAEPNSKVFFTAGKENHYQFDLPSYGLHKLKAAGIENPQWSGHCTYSNPELFYSYRRSVHQKEADYGRLISAIRL